MKSFSDILYARTAGSAARDWLEKIWPARLDAGSDIGFRAAFAGMARRLGTIPLTAADIAQLQALGIARPESWDLVLVGRLALLLRAIELLPRSEQAGFVRRLYQRGDSREQAAVLRALQFLPAPADCLEVAVEACRTNVPDVFASLALDNPYPARHFPALNFNQLVLKTIFLGLDTHFIQGLADRTTAELKRMVSDFAAERRAAGRPVPADTDYILGLGAA